MEAFECFHEGYPAASLEGEGGERSAQPRTGQLVVHVEDDDDVRSLCAEILSEAGFEVLGCPTVLAAKVAIRARLPDVLLVDRDLPDGTGLDLARWVRSNPSFASVPIVVFSGRKSREDVERALVAGCDAFIGKPCEAAMLVETITNLA